MRGAVDPERHAADDRDAGRRQPAPERPCDLQPVRRRTPRADDRDRVGSHGERAVGQARQPAGSAPATCRTAGASAQVRRRGGVVRVVAADGREPSPGAGRSMPAGSTPLELASRCAARSCPAIAASSVASGSASSSRSGAAPPAGRHAAPARCGRRAGRRATSPQAVRAGLRPALGRRRRARDGVTPPPRAARRRRGGSRAPRRRARRSTLVGCPRGRRSCARRAGTRSCPRALSAAALVGLAQRTRGAGRERDRSRTQPAASMCALQVAPVPRSRAVWRSRAAITRSRTRAPSGSPRSAAQLGGRPDAGRRMRSMRSSSGPLSRRRWRARSAVGAAAAARRREAARARVRRRDEHEAASGRRSARCPRTIATRPSSSGWRSASSAAARTRRARRGTARRGARG